MKKLLIILGVLLLLAVMLFSWYRGGYNQAIAKDEEVKSAWAQVENQLQRRNDLIPNLVRTVQGFASQESDIFKEVTRLRSQWGKSSSIGSKIENANATSSALSRLLLVSENYPQLKSNENFLALQAQLEGTENRITVARNRYIEAIKGFNNLITVPPTSWYNSMFLKHTKKPQFEIENIEKAQNAPEVKF